MAPKTMKRYTIAHRNGIDGLRFEADAPVPELKTSTEIRINIKAMGLNIRDVQIITNDYPAPHRIPEGCVPVSGEFTLSGGADGLDGSGVVESVGSEVTLFKVGDKVCPLMPQGHHWEEDMKLRSLKRTLGGGIDGVAAEYFVCDQEEAVLIPSTYDFLDASTLPGCATTAWSSLFGHTPSLQPGQTVLCLGTGGVSLYGAQIALVAGARVILTSSSQTKLDRAVGLLKPLIHPNAPPNTLQTIDYSKIDAWDVEARRLNGDQGVDFVIEIAGRGTIGRSIRATRMGGLVAVSGYMSDYKPIPDHIIQEDIAKLTLYSAASVRGVFICNREQFKTLNRALDVGGVRPIIDKVFKFEELKEAYQYMADGRHFGRIAVKF